MTQTSPSTTSSLPPLPYGKGFFFGAKRQRSLCSARTVPQLTSDHLSSRNTLQFNSYYLHCAYLPIYHIVCQTSQAERTLGYITCCAWEAVWICCVLANKNAIRSQASILPHCAFTSASSPTSLLPCCPALWAWVGDRRWPQPRLVARPPGCCGRGGLHRWRPGQGRGPGVRLPAGYRLL